MTIAPLFPILPPTGDDAELYGAWKLAEQKWRLEVESLRQWSADPSERNRKAWLHDESMTNEAVALLFNAHRDAELRRMGIQPAA